MKFLQENEIKFIKEISYQQIAYLTQKEEKLLGHFINQ